MHKSTILSKLISYLERTALSAQPTWRDFGASSHAPLIRTPSWKQVKQSNIISMVLKSLLWKSTYLSPLMLRAQYMIHAKKSQKQQLWQTMHKDSYNFRPMPALRGQRWKCAWISWTRLLKGRGFWISRQSNAHSSQRMIYCGATLV